MSLRFALRLRESSGGAWRPHLSAPPPARQSHPSQQGQVGALRFEGGDLGKDRAKKGQPSQIDPFPIRTAPRRQSKGRIAGRAAVLIGIARALSRFTVGTVRSPRVSKVSGDLAYLVWQLSLTPSRVRERGSCSGRSIAYRRCEPGPRRFQLPETPIFTRGAWTGALVWLPGTIEKHVCLKHCCEKHHVILAHH